MLTPNKTTQQFFNDSDLVHRYYRAQTAQFSQSTPKSVENPLEKMLTFAFVLLLKHSLKKQMSLDNNMINITKCNASFCRNISTDVLLVANNCSYVDLSLLSLLNTSYQYSHDEFMDYLNLLTQQHDQSLIRNSCSVIFFPLDKQTVTQRFQDYTVDIFQVKSSQDVTAVLRMNPELQHCCQDTTSKLHKQ